MKLSGFSALAGFVAASCVALRGPVVRAAGAEPQSARGNETEPLPPPGTSRLISIGPQALVREDDHGHLTMVDDPEPQRSKLQVVGIMLGTMTAGVVIVFSPAYRTDGPNGDR